MATLSGYLITSGLLQDDYADLSANIGQHVAAVGLGVYGPSVDCVWGTRQANHAVPIGGDSWAVSGMDSTGFGDFLWQQIFIIVEADFYCGEEVEVGLVVVPVSYDVEIWNSYLTQSATLNSLTWTDADGITTSGLTPPATMGKLQSLLFTLTASEIGPVVIAASGLFAFDVGNKSLLVTGTRGLPIITPPDRDGYAEVRWWATDIYKTQDGTEKRDPLMDVAKRAVESNITTDEEMEVQRMESLLLVGSKYIILQPLWYSKTTITADTDGTTTIYVDTTDREFVVGDFVMLRLSDLYYDIKKIETVAATYITVDKAPASFKAGTAIVPMIKATPEMLTSWGGKNKRFQRFQIKAKEI